MFVKTGHSRALTPTVNPSNPVRRIDPRTLGVFDEESCRYFLREVGAVVVPQYPFALGMEEVYRRILIEYGEDGAPDACSVLEELLETKRDASGLGDDGDIWRCWQGHWKHRNHNLLNPFIPRVGIHILQPATLPQIRQIKTENFFQMSRAGHFRRQPNTKPAHAQQEFSSDKEKMNLESTQDSSQQLLPATVFSDHDFRSDPPSERPTLSSAIGNPQPRSSLPTSSDNSRSALSLLSGTRQPDSRPSLPSLASEPSPALSLVYKSPSEKAESIKTDTDSEQEFVEVTSSLDPNLDPNLLLTFEMLPSSSSTMERPVMRSGHSSEPELYTLRQVESPAATPVTAPSYNTTPHLPSATDSSILSSNPPSVVAGDCGYMSVQKLGEESEAQKNFTRHVDIEALPLKAAVTSRAVNPFARNLGNQDSPVNVTRAMHRQAKVIDGAILSPRIWKRLSSQPFDPGKYTANIDDQKMSSSRRSWTPLSRHTNSKRIDLQDSKRLESLESKRKLFRETTRIDSRNSLLLRGLRTLFRKTSRATETKVLDVKVKSPDAHTAINISRARECTDGRSTNSANHPMSTFGLDGTSDDRASPAKSSLDINKALPLSPGEIVRSLSHRSTLSPPANLVNGDFATNLFSSNPITRTMSSQNSVARTATSILPHTLSQHELLLVAGLGLRRSQSLIDPTKVSPLISPISYSSIANLNPYTFERVPLSPVRAPPPLFEHRHNPSHFLTSNLPKSSTEPTLTAPTITDLTDTDYQLPAFIAQTPPDSSPEMEKIAQTSAPLTPKRGIMSLLRIIRSPIRFRPLSGRLLQSSPQEPQLTRITDGIKSGGETESIPENTARFRFGDSRTLRNVVDPPSHDVSLDPPTQSHILSSVELILVTTCNQLILREYNASRISSDSVDALAGRWAAQGHPAVLEFQYDNETQRSLITANLTSVKLHGACNEDTAVLNGNLLAWLATIQFLKLRLYCHTDAAIRKFLHEAVLVVEMLGAPPVTRMVLEDLQIAALTKISQVQKSRVAAAAA